MKRPVSLDRREAYARARAAAEPQRGRSYEELFLDNLIGLDNDYTSTVESMADVYNQDKVGFLKNAGIAALQGAKQAVLHPIDTATGMVSDIYESGANVAKTLGPDPTYLNDALQELYGVGIEDATDDQISGAREALLGDIFAVGSMIPVGKVAGTGVMAAEEAIDAAQRAQMRELQRSVVPKYYPEAASGSRPYTPSRAEVDQMLQNPTATQELYLQSKQQAEDLLAQGVDPEVVLRMTGVMPVPLRTSTGADYGYRLVSALPEEDFTAYRPQGIAEVVPTFRKKLPKGVSGSFSQTDEQRAASLKSRLEGRDEPDSYTLAINQKQSLPKKQATWTHEVGHYDYREGDLGYSEIGSDPKFDRENKRRALETLNNLISTTNDPDELARLHAARDELSSLTGKELYSRNPGEMAARLAEGDPTMLKRLTVLQTLNPYINTNVSFPKRVGQAARTALFSETRPSLLGPAFSFPYDRHVRVPMDMGKALISDPNYTPINTFNVFDPNLDVDGATLLPDDLPSGNSGAFPSMLSASDSYEGPPRMGDNFGPPLDDELFDENGFLRLDDMPVEPPKRFINPSTGMYSPSYEAARTLKQEVGTPQQMRAMLLNNGAKEEELAYSGFDEWLRTKGDQKVTKQEIEDILGVIAAGRDDDFTGMAGSMPFMSTSFKATGVTGAARDALGDARENVYQDMVARASQARENRIRTQLADRGYVPLQLRTEEQFRQLEQNVGDYTQTPARVLNTIDAVNEMLRAGEAFDSPTVQNRLRAMNGENNFVVGRDGIPRYIDEAMREVLPDDYNEYPYPNDISNDERDLLFDQMTQMSPQEVADYLGLDPQDFEESFIPEQTSYGSYAPEGLMDYSENLYMFDDTGRGVTQGLEALGATTFQQPHYSGQVPLNAPIMFHTRTGRLQTPSGPAHHIAEMQSDIAQSFRGKTDQLAIPGVDNSFKLDKGQKAVLKNYVDQGRKLQELDQQADEKWGKIYDDFLDPDTGKLMKDAPGYSEAVAEIRALRNESEALKGRLFDLEGSNPDLFTQLSGNYGDVRTLNQVNGFAPELTVDLFDQILSGKAPENKLRGKTTALPFATSTNRWVDAALKNELIKAANSDAEWFTLPKGKDVVRYTRGKEEGQAKFYEGIVPTRLKGLASKFLPEGVEFQELTAQGFGKNAPQYKVFGMRLTPELKQYIRENGFPTFKKGGVVDGSSLDVDIFALD